MPGPVAPALQERLEKIAIGEVWIWERRRGVSTTFRHASAHADCRGCPATESHAGLFPVALGTPGALLRRQHSHPKIVEKENWFSLFELSFALELQVMVGSANGAEFLGSRMVAEYGLVHAFG